MVLETERTIELELLKPRSDKCALFWAAVGDHYIQEAQMSMLSAKKHMPDIPCYLFANSLESPAGFDKMIKMPPHENKYLFMDLVNYIVLGLEHMHSIGVRHAVYFDTDIFVCAPIYEIFDLTRYCDIAGAFAPARKTTAHLEAGLPTSIFPEINGGVMAMYVPTMIDFFKSVYESHRKFQDAYEGNDQGVIRDMMLSFFVQNETFRYHILPPEYNCRFNLPTAVCGEVKILHGRGDDLDKVCSDINAQTGMRLWLGNRLIT